MGNSDNHLDVTQLIEEHHAALYRYAFRFTGSAADAEDLLQQTFLSAHRKLHQLRKVESVKSWLFTILRNNYLKSCRGTEAVPASAANIDLNDWACPDEMPGSPIDSENLQKALNELPGEFRIVLLMYFFEDYSYAEISEQLKLPAGTVMSRLHRAKCHLRRRLIALETATVNS